MHLALSAAVGLAFLAASGQALPHDTRYVVHEKRDDSFGWIKRNRLPHNAVVPVKIALTQKNLEHGEELLMDISNPLSPNYGNHLSLDDVVRTFAPSDETVHATKAWLAQSGIGAHSIVTSGDRGTLMFNATIAEVEQLLQAEYFLYKDAQRQSHAVACEKYHVPAYVSEHIDYINPGIGLPFIAPPSTGFPKPRRELVKRQSIRPPLEPPKTFDLAKCSEAVFPDCVRALYNITDAKHQFRLENKLGIYSLNATYLQKDMDIFFKAFTPKIPQGTRSNIVYLNGAKEDFTFESALNEEADVDFQVAWPLVYPENITLFNAKTTDKQFLKLNSSTTDQSVIAAELFADSLDDLLGAFDNRYCNKSTGSPCGTLAPPQVLSISYGPPEDVIPRARARRICHEFLKMGLQGTTILSSSGDGGVLAVRDNECIGPEGKTFSPVFPASCPWVTAVGATQIDKNKTINDPESAAFVPLLNFSSGGGFSNYFKRPPYQVKTIAKWFDANPSTYPSYDYAGTNASIGANGGRFNRLGKGIPDISAIGANLYGVYGGNITNIGGGTSASTPLIASMLWKINAERLSVGKRTVGFVNRVLYAERTQRALRDIRSGHNTGCGTNGFNATAGWDPVTGLGVPDYQKLKEVFLALP